MTKRMLIDSTHAEETRVVVLDGTRLDEYDVETSTKRQLKGNIYLAKVVRVEPSLQAAFVEYGGNRHGFLAFGEIHPDYYQIPVADRQRLIALQEAEAREEEEAEERAAVRDAQAPAHQSDTAQDTGPDTVPDTGHDTGHDTGAHPVVETEPAPSVDFEPASMVDAPSEPGLDDAPQAFLDPVGAAPGDVAAEADAAGFVPPNTEAIDLAPAEELPASDEAPASLPIESVTPEPDAPVQLGGELETEYQRPERSAPKFTRHYQIQEVIRRRQILLIQVVKEERGSKGAALTTYISLAGRFSVLMPNSPRGGGISRKITSASDRRRLKEVTAELDLPRGMGLIVRTAGANRPKPEILRDGEYLLNQWDQIRDLTMKSMAPALIYEEASLIKRAIRDVYSRDVDDILVDGEEGWRAARDFIRMLMPTHAKKVQLWKDPQPLFAKAQVEAQLDAMLVPTVQLKSGGYLVINQTEALVAIDVNSGRSTRERSIEDTALRTNLEAADEAARQLRLRDLAGLIVIDFIDMESRRNNAAVEKRLKDALKLDRARIQLGSISHFGLLEMSRQRLRPSLAETSFVQCPHCTGTGTIRSTESASLHVLRTIEEEGSKRCSAEIVVYVAGAVALYILNHKRQRLAEVEQRYGMVVTFAADETLLVPLTRIERVRAQTVMDGPAPVSQLAPPEPFEDEDELPEEAAPELAAPQLIAGAEIAEDETSDDETAAARPGETAEEGEQRSRRRRRRRGGRREDGADASATATAMGADMVPEAAGEDSTISSIGTIEPGGIEAGVSEAGIGDVGITEPGLTEAGADESAAEDGERKRRGRRGGRRRRREPGEAALAGDAEQKDTPEPGLEAAFEPVPAPIPAYAGPTPANPFAGTSAYDIFDAIEQAEQERALAITARIAAVAAAEAEVVPVTLAAPEPMAVQVAVPALADSEPTLVVADAPEPERPEPESAALPTTQVATSAPLATLEHGAPVSETPVSETPVSETPVSETPVATSDNAPGPADHAEPEPAAAAVPEAVSNGPVPTLITSDEPVAAPKRGWWRR